MPWPARPPLAAKRRRRSCWTTRPRRPRHLRVHGRSAEVPTRPCWRSTSSAAWRPTRRRRSPARGLLWPGTSASRPRTKLAKPLRVRRRAYRRPCRFLPYTWWSLKKAQKRPWSTKSHLAGPAAGLDGGRNGADPGPQRPPELHQLPEPEPGQRGRPASEHSAGSTTLPLHTGSRGGAAIHHLPGHPPGRRRRLRRPAGPGLRVRQPADGDPHPAGPRGPQLGFGRVG